MQRPLAAHERELLHFLLTVNESLYSAYVSQWRAQLETCTVREVNVPYCLAFNHSEERLPCGAFVLLVRDLIGIDEGVSLLIYAYVVERHVLGTFWTRSTLIVSMVNHSLSIRSRATV